MAGVLGSLVGASAAVATAWVTQENQSKRKLIQEEMRLFLLRNRGGLFAHARSIRPAMQENGRNGLGCCAARPSTAMLLRRL